MSEAEKKELEGIRYIKEKNDMQDMKTVLALYNKLSEKELFHTQAGVEFMEELRDKLIAAPEVDNHEIAGYKAVQSEKKKDEKKEQELKPAEEKKKEIEQRIINEYRYKYYNSLIINVILIIALVLGFLITTNSKNVNIINYENRLIDKYAAWEEQLEERESIVTEREKAVMQP